MREENETALRIVLGKNYEYLKTFSFSYNFFSEQLFFLILVYF